MSLSVLTRKGKVPRYHFLPLRSQSWLKKQISVGSFFRARFLDTAQLLLLTEAGAWDLASPQAPQPTKMKMVGGAMCDWCPSDCDPGWLLLPLG